MAEWISACCAGLRSPQGPDSREYGLGPSLTLSCHCRLRVLSTGFFDLTLSKSAMTVELVNHLGNVVLTHSVQPFAGHAPYVACR